MTTNVYISDALKSKLCKAAKSVHVLSIAYNAMLVGTVYSKINSKVEICSAL